MLSTFFASPDHVPFSFAPACFSHIHVSVPFPFPSFSPITAYFHAKTLKRVALEGEARGPCRGLALDRALILGSFVASPHSHVVASSRTKSVHPMRPAGEASSPFLSGPRNSPAPLFPALGRPLPVCERLARNLRDGFCLYMRGSRRGQDPLQFAGLLFFFPMPFALVPLARRFSRSPCSATVPF